MGPSDRLFALLQNRSLTRECVFGRSHLSGRDGGACRSLVFQCEVVGNESSVVHCSGLCRRCRQNEPVGLSLSDTDLHDGVLWLRAGCRVFLGAHTGCFAVCRYLRRPTTSVSLVASSLSARPSGVAVALADPVAMGAFTLRAVSQISSSVALGFLRERPILSASLSAPVIGLRRWCRDPAAHRPSP